MPWKKSKNKYIAQVRRNGQRRERVFQTLKEAKAWEAKQRKLSSEEWNGKTNMACLIDWAQAYLDHARSMYATKTYKEKTRMFKNFFNHADPTMSVSKLTPATVMDYLLKQKEQRSGYAANKDRKNLIAAWNWGLMYMTPLLPSPNPCAVKKMPEIRQPRYVPPAEDFWKVYDMAEGQDRVLLLTFLHTAARRGEIFRLTVSDLD
ncbi:MAG: hypothetical protein N2F24_20030, partial [Deltaproteobacteria bacterium]